MVEIVVGIATFISVWIGAFGLGFKLKKALQEHDDRLRNELKKEFKEHDSTLQIELQTEWKNEINQLEERRNIRIGELDAKVDNILQGLGNLGNLFQGRVARTGDDP